MTLIQPSSWLARLVSAPTVSAAASLLTGPVAVAELSVELPALTDARFEEDGR